MNSVIKLGLVAGVAAVLGAGVTAALLGRQAEPGASGGSSKEPLYWVAPMDPSYRRDKPGKSPMGMDLVPVYAEDAAGGSPGMVSIAPEVVNNLGVRTGVASLGELGAQVDTVGYVRYDEDRLVHVHPRVAGWIETLFVKAAGDPVKQGEPLYTLYSPTLVNAQEELLLAIKRGNPTLIGAAADRLQALQVPAPALEQLRKTGKVSRTITLFAPQDGVVDNLKAREGMYVEPGMKIMSIGTLERVWVIAEVFERQASLVHVGDPVKMRLDYLPGREWRGQVDYIYPSLNPKTRTVQLRIGFDNPDDYLRPGMFTQIEIDGQPGENTLLVPREALIRTGAQQRVVLALGEGRFKSVAVEVGRIAGDNAEILSGLQAGDRIVTSAQFLIDSESSRTSDFERMSAPMAPADQSGEMEMDTSGSQGMDHSGHDAMDMGDGAVDHSGHAAGAQPDPHKEHAQ